MTAYDIKEQVEFSVNGERVALVELNTRMSETDPKNGLDLVTPPVHIKAGPQRVTAAFVQKLDGPVDDLLMPLENTLADVSITWGVTMLPHLRDFVVQGPLSVTGVSDTPSRLKIFSCRPTAKAEEGSCATEIVKELSTQLPAARRRRRSSGRHEVLRTGPRQRGIRVRYSARRAADPDEPAVPVPPRAAA